MPRTFPPFRSLKGDTLPSWWDAYQLACEGDKSALPRLPRNLRRQARRINRHRLLNSNRLCAHGHK